MSRFTSKTIMTGFLSVFLVAGIGSAHAATDVTKKINDALGKKDMGEIQSLMTANPADVDTILRALLKKTQSSMKADPEFSGKMMSFAGQHAKQITPPSVPEVCADMRRIVDTLGGEQAESELFKSVMAASENFAKAPVVIAAGRPNQCELAWLDVANDAGEDALLAQMPSMRGPGLPPTTVRPGIPPSAEDKSSAD